MQPNNSNVALAGDLPRRGEVAFQAGRRCFLVEEALDDDTAKALVEFATTHGLSATGALYPPSYRDNDRLVWDDAGLAARLFERIRPLLPPTLTDDNGRGFRLVGLNSRFRFCRYRDGQSFRVHQDGAYARTPEERSRLTLQIYLDDAAGFDGGTTRFYDARYGRVTGAVVPSRGTAIVFDHALWHDGAPVTAGVKHVMRTDVMYRAESSDDGTAERDAPGHAGYIYCVRRLADGRLASGSRDCTVRIWTGDGTRCLSVLRGHRGSVVALAETAAGALLSGSRDGTVRLWDASGETSRTLLHGDAATLSIVPLLGADAIAVGTGDGTIRLIQSETGEEVGAWVGHRGWVWALSALPGFVVSGSEDGSLRLWHAASGSCTSAASPGRGPVHAVTALEGDRVAAGFADGHVVVYALDRSAGTLGAISVLAAHEGEVYTVTAVMDERLATGGEDGWARVFRLRDGACIGSTKHDGFVRGVAAAPDGLVVSGGYDGTLRFLCA